MATKLGRKVMPPGHTREDFECFGPPATKDGEFDKCMIADLGCFQQEGVDSNKAYHGAVVKSKKTGAWYAYYEWGRTGQNADFQFTECHDQDEAQRVMAKQLLSKNLGRGEWTAVAGREVLRPKKDKHGKTKDLYLVRPAARRTTGLPDAQKVIHDDTEGKKATKKTAKKTRRKTIARWDAETMMLGKALTNITIDYTRKSFAGDHIPTQAAIEEARDYLTAALQRVKVVGDLAEDQVKDQELRDLTSMIYGRIPKAKPLKASASSWILSSPNIQGWQLDLDTFESALQSLDAGGDDVVTMDDPFSGFDLEMKWCDPKTVEHQFIKEWMPEASANRHHHVGNMVVKNIWALRQPSLAGRFSKKVVDVGRGKKAHREHASFQPRTRKDLGTADRTTFKDANVAMLFHGTRSVNVSGILRTGLKLPRQLVGVAITGAMFGPGVYWADDWRKSDGYTSREGTYWSRGSGGVKGRGAFMFVGNVALGNPYVANTWGGYTEAPRGYHSVAGLAGKSGVQNNEWIVYDATQNDLVYLVEYDTKRGR